MYHIAPMRDHAYAALTLNGFSNSCLIIKDASGKNPEWH
jgi:hypothetical protein